MENATWVMLLVGVMSLVMTLILFLVGRLLTANREAIESLNRALRDITTVIEALRTKVHDVEIAVVRLEAMRESAHVEPLREVRYGD